MDGKATARVVGQQARRRRIAKSNTTKKVASEIGTVEVSPKRGKAGRRNSTVAEELLQTRMSNKSLLASSSASTEREAERLKRFKMSGKAFGGSLKRLESGAIVHPHSESYDAAWIDWMENKEKKTYVPKVWKVALTGGPCAGKTSSLSEISNFFRSRGWNVFTSREAASVLLGGGVDFTKCNSEQVYEVQNRILKIMCTIEDSYTAICEAANPGEKCLVVCDRGIMDASVYCDKPTWERCLAFNGLTHDSSDSRYDGVIHLVTAADGAEDFYSLETNAEGVRTESAEAARELDMKTRAVWEGHPSLNIIDNSTDFASKVKRVVAAVCGIVGEVPPSKHLKRRKFLARSFNLRGSGFNVQTVNCEYAYLISSDGKQHRLRRRIADGSILYTHIRRMVDQDGHVMDIKNNITRREYLELLCHQDPNRMLIRLVRQTFAYQNRQFACNTIVGLPPQNLAHLSSLPLQEDTKSPKDLNTLLILTVQADDDNELVMPPSGVVGVEKEVTGLEEYSMYHLSKRGAKGSSTPTPYHADGEVTRRLKSG